jgi:hypothetical protein
LTFFLNSCILFPIRKLRIDSGMELLVKAARWEMIILVVCFAGVTLWRLLSSGSLAGILRSSDGTFSPGRVQLLVLTILTALEYLLATIHDPSHLQTIPSGLVTVLGGSQAVYLGSKAIDVFGLFRK